MGFPTLADTFNNRGRFIKTDIGGLIQGKHVGLGLANAACYACRPKHPLTGKKAVKLRDIFDFPIAIPWLPEAAVKALVELAGLPLKSTLKLSNGIIECQYFKVLIETAKACDAIGLGLEPIFEDAVEKGDLVYPPIFTPQITSQFGIVSMKGYSLPPAVEAFQLYVIKAARESNLLFGESKERV